MRKSGDKREREAQNKPTITLQQYQIKKCLNLDCAKELVT